MKFKKLASISSILIISASMLVGCNSAKTAVNSTSNNAEISEEATSELVDSFSDTVEQTNEDKPSGDEEVANAGDDIFNKMDTEKIKKNIAKNTVQAKSESKEEQKVVIKATSSGDFEDKDDIVTVETVKEYLQQKYGAIFAVDGLSSFYVGGSDEAEGQVTLACPKGNLDKIFTVWYVGGSYYDSYESLGKEEQVDAILQSQLNRHIENAKVIDYYTQIMYYPVSVNSPEIILNSSSVYHDVVIVVDNYEDNKENIQDFMKTLSQNSNYHVYVFEDENPISATRKDYKDISNKDNLKYETNLSKLNI